MIAVMQTRCSKSSEHAERQQPAVPSGDLDNLSWTSVSTSLGATRAALS